MKKRLLYIAIALAAIGCAKSETAEYTPADGEISFSAGFTTRVSAADDCEWSSTDIVGIFTNQSDEENLKFTIYNTSTGAMSNQSGQVLIPLDEDARTYYAYHPYSEAQNNEPTISIDLTKGYDTPLLWATATTNDTKVPLQFTHMLPKVTINLKAGGVDVTLLDENTTATLKGAYAEAYFNITGTTLFSEEKAGDITLSIGDNNVITAYLIPMTTVSSSVKLWITAGGNTFVYPFATEKWESGNKYEYDIVVGEAIAVDND